MWRIEIWESRGGLQETSLDTITSDQTEDLGPRGHSRDGGMEGRMGGGGDGSRTTAWIWGDGSWQVSGAMSQLGSWRNRTGKGNQEYTHGGPLPSTPTAK